MTKTNMMDIKNKKIAELQKISEGWEEAKYEADAKIDSLIEVVDLLKEKDEKRKELLKELQEDKRANLKKIDSLIEKNSNQKMQINKLWEHVDVLENNPLRRMYKSITNIFKYRMYDKDYVAELERRDGGN